MRGPHLAGWPTQPTRPDSLSTVLGPRVFMIPEARALTPRARREGV